MQNSSIPAVQKSSQRPPGFGVPGVVGFLHCGQQRSASDTPREKAELRNKIAGLTMEYFQPTRSVSKRQQ